MATGALSSDTVDVVDLDWRASRGIVVNQSLGG
jgi:hypothetical protein